MKKSGLLFEKKGNHRIWSVLSSLILILVVGSLIFLSGCKKDSDDEDPPAPVVLFGDDFDGSTLNSNWKWANEPENWDLGTSNPGWLTFTGNLNANIFCDDNTSRLYQHITSNADFDISTKLYCEWGNNSSDVAGLIIKSAPTGDWVMIKLWMHGNGTGRLEFQKQCNDIISPVPGSESDGGSTEIFIRIKKTGSDYTSYFKNHDADAWIMIGTVQFSDDLPLQIGLFGGVDGGDGNLLVRFDYFHI